MTEARAVRLGVIAAVLLGVGVLAGFGIARVTGDGAPGATPLEPSSVSSITSDSSAADASADTAIADLYVPPADLPAFIERVQAATLVVDCGDSDQGSAFVLDSSALTGSSAPVIVTNRHVIRECLKGGPDVRINAGGLRRSGPVLIADPRNDLALLDIPDLDIAKLDIIPLALSTEASVGQWVMATGDPMGYRGSVSAGIVSAIVPRYSEISSDAVIGSGSSGGPLVNSRGEVIAVNTAVWEDAPGITLSRQIAALCDRVLKCLEE